jgi:hypothetical protein
MLMGGRVSSDSYSSRRISSILEGDSLSIARWGKMKHCRVASSGLPLGQLEDNFFIHEI